MSIQEIEIRLNNIYKEYLEDKNNPSKAIYGLLELYDFTDMNYTIELENVFNKITAKIMKIADISRYFLDKLFTFLEGLIINPSTNLGFKKTAYSIIESKFYNRLKSIQYYIY
ncbi:MAG: hypothetical protein KGD61_10990 [Candidatus Lokiarchaeota archaeon]|nr:hypothetical protein [Candidatus Lokiarchaeota archaeon]